MELETAVQLIGKGVSRDGVQSWVDLGAGSGLFTNALSKLLNKGSSITAVDKKLSRITIAPGINLQTITGDFTLIDLNDVDGILMANALHYVKDQRRFIERISEKTKRLILVEYNTDTSNKWVPYPISFNRLKSAYPNAEQIGSAASSYQRSGIYSALLLF